MRDNAARDGDRFSYIVSGDVRHAERVDCLEQLTGDGYFTAQTAADAMRQAVFDAACQGRIRGRIACYVLCNDRIFQRH